MVDFALPAGASPVGQLILPNLAAEGISMDPQNFRRAALIPLRTVQHALDEALFKLADCFLEHDSAIHHLRNQSF